MDGFEETREALPQFNPCLLSSLRFISACAAFIVLSAAALILTGWIAEPATFVVPGYRAVVMLPNAALAFVLCPIALWVGARSAVRRTVAYGSSAIVLLVGAITVLENILGLQLRTDYVLLTRRAPEQLAADPWRLAPVSGLGLMFLSLSLFMAMRKTENGARASQLLAGAAFLDALLGFMDQILNPEVSQLHVPLATVALLALMAFAIFLSRPDEGAMKVIAADGLGGAIARRLFPAAILVSVLIAWVRWRGQSRGYFEPEVGAALGVVIQVALFAWLILANANHLEKADQLRKRAEEVARRESEKVQQRSADQIVELLAKTKDLQRQLENSSPTGRSTGR